MTAGYFFKDYLSGNSMIYVMMFLEGVLCVAVAVIAQAFWGLSTKYRNNKSSLIVIGISCAAYIAYPTGKYFITKFHV